MFGANPFGVPYFAQLAPSRVAPMLAAATVAVATTAALTATPALAAVPAVSLGSDATLLVQGPLLAEATLSLGTTSALGLRAVLAAAATIPVGTVATATVTADLHASATIPIALAAPRLDVGVPRFAATAAIPFGVTPPRLSTLPADWRASAGVRLGTVASISQVGAGATTIVIAFNGSLTTQVRRDSITISDVLNEAPNTCDFIVDKDPPAAGTDVKIGLQNLLVQNLLFAGTVKRRQQQYDVATQQVYWTINCEDYTYLLNRRRVFGSWGSVSASTIAHYILTGFTSGFSHAGIAADLPPVTVTWVGITVMDALSQLAGLIGGYTKVDYGKVVWLFVTDPNPAPTPVTPGNPLLMFKPAVTPTIDLSQTRTRVDIKGAGVAVVGPADANLGPVPVMGYVSASPTGYSGSVSSKTVGYNLTAPANYLLAFVAGDFTVDRVTGTTWDGVAMTLLHKFYSGAQWFYVFGLANPTIGSLALTVTASGVCSLIDITAAAYSGVGGPGGVTHAVYSIPSLQPFTVPLPATVTGWAVMFAMKTGAASVTVTGGVQRAIGSTDIPVAVVDSAAAMGAPITLTAPAPCTWTGVCVALAASSVSTYPIPVADASMFANEGGTVISDDGQILPYTGKNPGGDPGAIIVGNVSGPTSGGAPALAIGVAGRLSGTYRWAVAFGNPQGETPVGPASPSLFCPDVTSPTTGPGLGPTGTVGPLAGAYDYRISYLTTLGETLAGPSAHRDAIGLAPPSITSVGSTPGVCRLSPGIYRWVATYVTQYGETLASAPMQSTQQDLPVPFSPSVQNANGAGPLAAGAPYAYRNTFVTQDGESAPGTPTTHVPSALALPIPSNFNAAAGFGGLLGGAYYYGMTYVTGLGESLMGTTQYAGSNLAMTYPGWQVYWSGGQDNNGRIQPGATYVWAASYYSDTYGETALGPTYGIWVGGTFPIRMAMNISNFRPTGADGVRIYRAIEGGPFLLNKEFRFTTGVPTSYWDIVSQGECGSNYPIQTLRAGVCMQVIMYPSNETGVIARRLYRTKAGGAEYFLVSEIQNNSQAQITDYFFDNQLAQRNPPIATTGRLALVNVPTGPTGTIGRRLYRSKRDLTSTFYVLGDIRDNTTPSFLDGVADEQLNSTMPTANTGGSSSIPVIGVPTGPPGVIARRLYRTQVNGSSYALVAELGHNNPASVTDNLPDSALSGLAPPAVSSAGGEQIRLTSIPRGPTGTLARLIYRTKAGGGEYGLVSRLSDNTTDTYVDVIPDESLGNGISLVNDAGSSAVNLQSVPTGPTGVTQRIIYRTNAGGNDFHYVGTIDNNTDTTFLDTRADKDLGRSPQATSTIGALIADTFLVLNTVANFPPAGWVHIDNQFVRYTSISGTTLVGIPAAGPGAIIAPIKGGSAVLTVPQLTGVSFNTPAQGVSAPLPVGSQLALWVVVNSADGQAALANLEGGDGVHEFLVTDSTLDSIAACTARGQAELLLFQYAQVSVDYGSRDTRTRSGATVTVNLPAPWNLAGDFTIQTVRITQIDIAPRTFPLFSVHCADTKFSLADLLRHVVLA